MWHSELPLECIRQCTGCSWGLVVLKVARILSAEARRRAPGGEAAEQSPAAQYHPQVPNHHMPVQICHEGACCLYCL